MRLRDNSLNVEGAKLYNSVLNGIWEYDGSYLEFKNLVDVWLSYILDIYSISGYEPRSRHMLGKPSNSIRDWSNYEDIACMNVWKCSQFLTQDSDGSSWLIISRRVYLDGYITK